MTAEEKANALSALIAEHASDKSVLRPMDSRLRWLGRAVPLLSFSPTLHQNALTAADILSRPGFSSSMYEQMEGRILLLVRQGITELEHDLTPPEPEKEEKKEKEEHTLMVYWTRGDWSERFGLIAVFGAIFVIGFLCGKVGFFGRLYDLIKDVIP